MLRSLPSHGALAMALLLGLGAGAPAQAENPVRATLQVREVTVVSGYFDESSRLEAYASANGQGTLGDDHAMWCLSLSGDFEDEGEWVPGSRNLCEIQSRLNVPHPTDGPLAKISELRRLVDKASRLPAGRVLACPMQRWQDTPSHPGGDFVGIRIGSCRIR